MSAIMVGQLTSILPDYTQAKLSAGLVFKIIESRSMIDNLSQDGLRPVSINENVHGETIS